VNLTSNLSVQLNITSSFGVSFLPGDATTPSELVEFADLALYEAKALGRNRVVSWHGESGARQETEHSTGGVSQSAHDSDKTLVVKPQPTPKPQQPRLPSDEATETNQSVDTRSAKTNRVLTNAAEAETNGEIDASRAITERQLLTVSIETAIQRAQQDANEMAVVVLDGTALQHIANNVDFNIGNQLCSVLVDRIRNLLRLDDVVSSTHMVEASGSVTQTQQNEIVVILSNIDAKKNITAVVERLLGVFDQRIVIGGVEYVVETNAGISVLGDDGDSAEVLFQHACIACSNARMSDTRNAYSYYSSQMDQAAKRHIRLQTDLHQAIEKHELEVFYQPKMDLMTGDLVGFEALLRWHHAQLGVISPHEFIPIAEKTGLITRINPWVRTEVIDQIKLWRESGHKIDSVAVNISAVELRDPKFSYKVLAMMKDSKIQPSSLEIEITESIGIEELDVARTNLENLSKAGMTISVDDFGTGYSSLGYLQHFPISRLKIDRAFVSGCTEDQKKARVVRSIITMGNSLGMRVLAEGVENQEQLLFLRDHHCDEVQGFFVSKPGNAEETTMQLEQSAKLSQVVLGAAMHANAAARAAVIKLPLSGLDSVISRFPDAANDRDQQELAQTSDQAG